MWAPVASVVGGLVLVLVLVAIVAAMRMRTKARRGSAGRSGEDRPLDPRMREAMEDEFRRRKDGSGPTVAGGQHLG